MPWIFWILFIIILISIPGNQLPELPNLINLFQPDKLVHLFLFLVLIFFIMRGFHRFDRTAPPTAQQVFYILLTGILLGGGTEIFQHFCIPMRIASINDFIANVLGSFAGWGVYVLYWRKRVNKINE